MTTLAEYAASRELMRNLTLRELRGRYKHSALGWAWSLVNPLATMVIFTVVFRYILGVSPPPSANGNVRNFALYLLCALLPWNFFINGVNLSIASLLANANLIKKTYFPRELLIGSQVAASGVSLFIELAFLTIVFLIVGNMVLPWLPIAVVLVAILALFVTGLGLALSVLNVYFRDIQHFVGILFQVWFYMTPVVYPIDLVEGRDSVFGLNLPVAEIYRLNPMVGFVEAFRDCFYHLRFPSPLWMAYLVAVSVLTFVGGLVIFNRREGRLAEEL